MTATVFETEERTTPVHGEGIVSHIVKPQGKKTASAIVTEARVMGIEVEALCGHRWVPSRNPKDYPVCSKCREIYEHDPFADDGAERQNELPPEA